MIERSTVEARYRKKQGEIAALEEKLHAARGYLSALNHLLKDDNVGEAPEANETKLRSGSAVDQAKDIILARQSPVHIDDILRAMGKAVTRDAKASLAGSLAAYVRREEIFSRPAPNTYGLIELGHSTTVEDEVEPPEDFGQSPAPAPAPPLQPPDDIYDDVPF